MDALTLDALVREIAPELAGAAVAKVHQPDRDTIILRLWTGRCERALLLCARPHRAHLRLTEHRFPNPSTPPRFCQLLRARLSRLLTLEAVPGEAIAVLGFKGPEGNSCSLICELFGGRPNLILTESEQRIIDVLHRRGTEGDESALPGGNYHRESLPGQNWLENGLPDLPVKFGTREEAAAWIRRSMAPMSRLVAADLAAALVDGEPPTKAFGRLREDWASGHFVPWTGRWQGRPAVTPFGLQYLELTEATHWPSVNEAVTAWADLPTEGIRDERTELAGAIRRQGRKLRNRLEKLAAEEVESGSGEEWQRRGELLLANLHRMRRGLESITVDDYYCDPPRPVSILLEPHRTPQENAERCFQLARKARRRVGHLARRREETLAELDWLDSVDQSLADVFSAGELLAIRQELEEFGLIRVLPGAVHRRRVPAPREQLHRAVSPGGFELKWGRNNRSNDFLCREYLGPEDLWFHAHRLPGCHLVLRRGGFSGEIPSDDILFAAAIAGGCSRGREAASIEVMVAEGRHVHKPKGARPGLVTVKSYRTVRVEPQLASTLREGEVDAKR